MDFTTLTDEQLLTLIKAAMDAAIDRGVGKIASTIYLDAQESARIQAETIEAAQEKLRIAEIDRLKRAAESKMNAEARKATTEAQSGTWSRKAAMMQSLKSHPLFKDDKDFTVNYWERSDGSESRIYIQGPKSGRKGNPEWEIIYYVSGSRYNAPGTIEGLGSYEIPVKAFCALVAKKWNPGINVAYGGVSGIAADADTLAEYSEALEMVANV